MRALVRHLYTHIAAVRYKAARPLVMFAMACALLIVWPAAAQEHREAAQEHREAAQEHREAAAVNRDLSMLYTRYAARQYRDGEIDKAAELAETALLYNAENPDALYMVGSAELRSGKPKQAGEYFSQALLYNRWHFFTSREGRLEHAEALYRQGKAKEAYHLLSPYHTSTSKNSPEFLLLYTQILRELGKREALQRSLQEALSLYPENDALQARRISDDAEYAQTVLSRLLEDNGDTAERYGKEVFVALMQSRSGEERRRLLEQYRERWSEDRTYRLYSLISGEANDAEAFTTFFSDIDHLSGEELSILISAAEEGGNKNALREGFASFTGTIEYDRDGNGTVERRERFVDGSPAEVWQQRSGESTDEYRVEFAEGQPSVFTLRNGAGVPRAVKIRYKNYPRVETVRWEYEEEVLEIRLVPYEYRFPLFVAGGGSIPESGPPYRIAELKRSLQAPDSAQLLPHASQIERQEDGEAAARYDRSTGTAEFALQNEEYSVRAEYAGAELEMRETRYRGEDTARITEWYRDGVLQTLLYDGNGNGTPEMIEHHGEDILQLWDFDEDGSIDYETVITETENAENE